MDFDHPPTNPIEQVKTWLKEAEGAKLSNPNAMALATIDRDGSPSVRMVLLKAMNERGAVFFTNRESRKGKALHANAKAALLLFWDALQRQVSIEGSVSPLSESESDAYFSSRDRLSQIGAWASRQSQPLSSRSELEASAAEVEKRFAGGDVPRPPNWGGYRVSLDRIEFWQGREHRLHDRIVYTPEGAGGWRSQRLYP